MFEKLQPGLKCKYCNSEWQSTIDVKICPFCGNTLAEPLVNSDIVQALRFIMDSYGDKINKNPNSIIAYLSDLAPNLIKERRLLKVCADVGIVAELLSITDDGEKSLATKRAVALLNGEHFIEVKRAEEAIGWLTESMGWTSSVNGISTAEEKQSEVAPAPNPQATEKRLGVSVELKPFQGRNTRQERIRKRREELKQYAERIVFSNKHILALRSDGTVIAYGDNSNSECNVSDWRNVTAIACSSGLSMGLTVDRTVLCANSNGSRYPWKNIVQIATWDSCPVGLCADGTVVADEKIVRDKSFMSWRNVTAIISSMGTIYGLMAGGTVVACGANSYGQCGVKDWKDVVSIVAGNGAVYGVRKDGRVYACGRSDYGQNSVDSWRDIIDIVPGYYNVFGLKSDGSVVCAGEKNARLESIRTWTDIVAVAHCLFNVVGLKADGTVVSHGDNIDTSGWRDIVAIACGRNHVVGLRADGTILVAGKAFYGEDKIAGQNLFR